MNIVDENDLTNFAEEIKNSNISLPSNINYLYDSKIENTDTKIFYKANENTKILNSKNYTTEQILPLVDLFIKNYYLNGWFLNQYALGDSGERQHLGLQSALLLGRKRSKR